MTDNFTTINQREHIASLLDEAQRIILSPHDDAESAAMPLQRATVLLNQLMHATPSNCTKSAPEAHSVRFDNPRVPDARDWWRFERVHNRPLTDRA